MADAGSQRHPPPPATCALCTTPTRSPSPPPSHRSLLLVDGQRHRRPPGGRRSHLLLRQDKLRGRSPLRAGRLPTCCFLVRPTPAAAAHSAKRRPGGRSALSPQQLDKEPASWESSSSNGAPVVFCRSDTQCRRSTLPLTIGRRLAEEGLLSRHLAKTPCEAFTRIFGINIAKGATDPRH